ncbi:MAG: SpoIIE family protein phosphatase [Methylomarinum sp.]|nr:SpoIIE family protein phosphatase [Methylomarinum sp.]
MQKKSFKHFTAMGITDVGNVRQHNEDSILIDDELALLLVADGMGGHDAGEVASMEAIKIIQQMLRLQQRSVKKSSWFLDLFSQPKPTTLDFEEKVHILENALHEANHHIYQLNLERNAVDGTGMGTTVAGCWFVTAETMLVFHIGDSRIYRFRNQKLQVLSKDHSILQEWHDNGCEGEKPKSNVILRAVGPYSETKPEIQVVQIKNKDSFLICSDGLTDMLDDSDIEKVMQALNIKQIEICCQNLLQAALEQGGKDNISIILLAQD